MSLSRAIQPNHIVRCCRRERSNVSAIGESASGGRVQLTWARRLLLALFIAATGWLTDSVDSAAEVPSWRTGQSSWNGTEYDTPPSVTSVYRTTAGTSAPNPVAATNIRSPETRLAAATRPSDDFMTVQASTKVSAPTIRELPPPADDALDEWDAEFGLSPPIIDPADDSSGASAIEPVPVPSLGERMERSASPNAPPLEDDVVRWYQYPWLWLTEGWENHAEFGLDGSSGNADTLAIQTGLEMKRKTDRYTLAFDVDYRQASANNTITEDNGRLNLDYDRLIADSQWTAFSKFGLEFDEFKIFDLRVNANGGIGYYWLRNDRSNLITRFGAGSSREIGSPDDDWKPEAIFGLEWDHQLTKRQKLKAKIDYFPVWTDFNDYRLVTDLAWETLLDSSDNLSLRLAVTDRYDSTPQGAEPNDFYYSMLLLYKF